ncbi:MAG: hypothetical protein AB7K09_22945 [Planctomycetota bacterium]
MRPTTIRLCALVLLLLATGCSRGNDDAATHDNGVAAPAPPYTPGGGVVEPDDPQNRPPSATLADTTAAAAMLPRALQWLRAHQDAVGAFTTAPEPRDPVATTTVGLAILAMMQDRHSHTSGTYSVSVKGGLRWLRACQAPGVGSFSDDPRAHAIATLAMCEDYCLTGATVLSTTAQFGVQHMFTSCWNSTTGRWQPERDLAWFAMVLVSARRCGFGTTTTGSPGDALIAQARAGLGRDAASDATALAVFALMVAPGADGGGMSAASERVMAERDTIDPLTRYLATFGMHRLGAAGWATWVQSCSAMLQATELADPATKLPQGTWEAGPTGAMTTALNALALGEMLR